MASAFIRNSLPGFKIDMTQAPRTDIITSSAFPGIAVTTSDEKGIHCISRYSLPLTNPELGLSPATVGVAASLLLPAVSNARNAAERATAVNNRNELEKDLIPAGDTKGPIPQKTASEAKGRPIE